MTEAQVSDEAPGAIPLTASLILAGLCFLWGGNLVSIKISNQGIPPLVAATVRSGLAALLLWVYARAKREGVLFPRRDWHHAIAIGLLFGLEFVFLYWGLTFTHASRGVIFVYAHPFWVALGAHLLLPSDRLTALKGAGLVLAFAGLVAVFGAQSEALHPQHWIGDFMMLGGGLCWAATTIYIKKMVANRDLTHYQTLFAQLAFSVPVLTVAWLVFQRGEPVLLTTPVVGAFVYQCVVIAFFSYLLWFWMIHRFSVSRLAAFTFLAPLFGVILSGVVLRESIPLLVWIGLAFVGAGIYLVNRPPAVAKRT